VGQAGRQKPQWTQSDRSSFDGGWCGSKELGLAGWISVSIYMLGIPYPVNIAQSLGKIGVRSGLQVVLHVGLIYCGWFFGVGVSSVSGLDSSEEAAWVEGSVGVELALDGLHEGEVIRGRFPALCIRGSGKNDQVSLNALNIVLDGGG